MYKTKIDLPETVRNKVVGLLNERLADAIDLMLQTKQAHWNVKGPHFISLHELFDKLHNEVREYVDTIAERATALGGIAEGTVRSVSKKTKLEDYPLSLSDGRDHLVSLSAAVAVFGKGVRAAIDQTDEWGDKGTSDLFTGISRGLDQYLWFLEAHLQTNQ